MKVRLYPRLDVSIWLVLTVIGVSTSVLSLRELRAGVRAIRLLSLSRPHAQDVIRMAEHNELAEGARLLGQLLFFTAGIAAMVSRPRMILGAPRLTDHLLPWILVAVEAILVGNSMNEYVLSRRVLKRRANLAPATPSVR